MEVIVKENERRDGLVNATTITYNGEPAILVVITDITERKQAEIALKQANKKLNMLSSITRHDLLNKLTALLSYMELSKEHAPVDTVFSDYLEKEIDIAESMRNQIDFTRFYQNIGMKKPDWVEVQKIIRKSAKQLNLNGIDLNIAINNLEVFADPLIEKTFYNLLENSVRHGKHVTSINISDKETRDGMVMYYSDNGIGIPDNLKEMIFEKGFGSNTGFGLFLSQEILSITGITIKERGEPEKGALFEIFVPPGAYRFMNDH